MKGLRVFLPILVAPLVFCGSDGGAVPAQRQAISPRQQSNTVAKTTRSDSSARQSAQRSRQPATVKERVTRQVQATVKQSRNVASQPRVVATRATTQKSERVTGARTAIPAVTSTARRTATSKLSSRVARATTTARNAATAQSIMSRDYSKCREVFNNCMDEFCANKDTQLKRCACSVRHSEFNKTKASLDAAEDKLLDFSQRLLTVNMDKEDAQAITQATEGELAYNVKDTSESKKLLDEISKKLNTSFDDSNFNQGLNAISLSLNMDAAFDNIDSLSGASTTTKIGTALYSAALPVCREMGAEVCTPDELSIAESSYQLMIEQDCNTVSKTYQAQVDQARSKIMESSALLDMSRLNIHQKRNSDDILTCKSKMLDMLTDASVCGDNMHKCLDTTGHFINPTTGQAFLTSDLYLLQDTLQRPSTDLTWQTVPANSSFVNFLNTKKEYLEPATENCQDIADTVWDSFLDDALAQIKLAQNSKLEEVRRSCTTLVAECIDDANKTIADFDARALSVFSISADKTANQMCNDVRNACTALMDNLDGVNGTMSWGDGVTGIMAAKTYDAIMQNCRVIGENCIIQACQSLTGNFGLCADKDSISRGSVLWRDVCWQDVGDCIASAGDDILQEIQQEHPLSSSTEIYTTTDTTKIFDFCQNECTEPSSLGCYKCRMTERIWGNCEKDPAATVANKILTPSNGSSTLLSWFASNTTDSCTPYDKGCSSYITISNGLTNCCNGRVMKTADYNICCQTGNVAHVQDIFNSSGSVKMDYYTSKDDNGRPGLVVGHGEYICVPPGAAGTAYPMVSYKSGVIKSTIYCVGDKPEIPEGESEDEQILTCDGVIIGVDLVSYNRLESLVGGQPKYMYWSWWYNNGKKEYLTISYTDSNMNIWELTPKWGGEGSDINVSCDLKDGEEGVSCPVSFDALQGFNVSFPENTTGD
ncbi:MAG: hypothetical protein IJE79_01750 [Alphaproteobacteria bacterium]|nr:hypothetical protein [Alphaproteobacteria bacterium]